MCWTLLSTNKQLFVSHTACLQFTDDYNLALSPLIPVWSLLAPKKQHDSRQNANSENKLNKLS